MRGNSRGQLHEELDPDGDVTNAQWWEELEPGTHEAAFGDDKIQPNVEGKDTDIDGTLDEWWVRGRQPDGTEDPLTQRRVGSPTPPPRPTPHAAPGTNTTGNTTPGTTTTPGSGEAGGGGLAGDGSDAASKTEVNKSPEPSPESKLDQAKKPPKPPVYTGPFATETAIGGTTYVGGRADGGIVLWRGDSDWVRVRDDGSFSPRQLGLPDHGDLNTNDKDLTSQLEALEAERAANERAQAAESERVVREEASAELDRLRASTVERLRTEIQGQPFESEIDLEGRTYQVDTRHSNWQETTVVDPDDATGSRTLRLGDLARRLASELHPGP